uniref:Uncharacterized protein n=1 Tax=Strombidinopsis acuminata TaxID=141414 RepID=A0A7S3T7R7_9SPIT
MLAAVVLTAAAAFQPSGLSVGPLWEATRVSTTPVCSAASQRRAFLLGATAAVFSAGSAPRPVAAADKGKAYNDCISKCVYEATKIAKGIAQVEVKPRDEAMAECKPKCLPLAVKK